MISRIVLKWNVALAGIVAISALVGCSPAPKAASTAKEVAAPDAAAQVTTAIEGEGYNARPDDFAEADVEDVTNAQAKPHAYSERDGDKFYYQTGGGQMLAVTDKGWVYDQTERKFSRVLVYENMRLINYVGSTIVHSQVFSPDYNGNVHIGPGEKFALSGDSVAAVAMRDALAGNLSAPANPPTQAEVDTAMAEQRVKNAEAEARRPEEERQARIASQKAADEAYERSLTSELRR